MFTLVVAVRVEAICPVSYDAIPWSGGVPGITQVQGVNPHARSAGYGEKSAEGYAATGLVRPNLLQFELLNG